jgi:hypothetical protein
MTEKIVDEFVAKVGQTINAQLTLTWDTKQTLEQYLEILALVDNGTDLFDEELFLEYVRSNAIDYVEDTTRHDGYIALENQFVVVNDQGEEIR